MRLSRLLFILPTLLTFCESPAQQPPPETDLYFPGETWRTSHPEDQGLDSERLRRLIDDLNKGNLQRPISSFTIVKNGYMVVSETFGSYDGETAHTMQSVTKSITGTLVGIAMQQGHIESLDQKVLDFFPEYDRIDRLDDHKRAMNLRHCLTMRTGQAWTGERHLGALNRFSGDKMKYVLDYEMEGAPGQKWYYNSGIAILMGGLLQNATRQNVEDFAQANLFAPLGISDVHWSWGHRGIPHTGGGLFLTPDAMLRIGYLYLRGGRWGDQQILPPSWIEESLQRRVPFAERLAGKANAGYGYMWWLLPMDPSENDPDILMAYGHWGQFIFIVPTLDMVVAVTNDRSASYAEELQPIRWFYDRVLPLVK